ncbi:hypothetical protein [Thiobacter aerophilum]|uniref:Conjugal transfer protein TraN n=1 Tax=Thiobacter aerophilum TaxID=3121275 RepID=A0ABV0EIK1_9BURK
MRAVAILMLFWAGAAIADQTSIFNDAKGFAAGKTVSSYGNINSGAVQDKIPGYGTNPPEAGYFAGGQGQTASFGVTKMQTCATATPDPDPIKRQECEAVNFLARNPQIRPQFNITKHDPMFARARAINQNAEAAAQQFGVNVGGSSTQCTTRTETTPAQYTTETCSSIKEIGEQQCTMGRVITIDTDANFQCEQTQKSYSTQQCSKTQFANVLRAYSFKMGDRCMEIGGSWCTIPTDVFVSNSRYAFSLGMNKMMINGVYVDTMPAPLDYRRIVGIRPDCPFYLGDYWMAICAIWNDPSVSSACDYVSILLNGRGYGLGRATIVSQCGQAQCTNLRQIVSSEGIVGYACDGTAPGAGCPSGFTLQPDGSCLDNNYPVYASQYRLIASGPTVIQGAVSATEYVFLAVSTQNGCATLEGRAE